MKALTIKQPWASLIMDGRKPVENRTWRTGVRGRIAIHSSAKPMNVDDCDAAYEILRRINGGDAVRAAEMLLACRSMPTGVILGTVELVDCMVASDSPWFTGPYGFVLRDPILFETPIPAKGKLGFWEWEEGTR